MLKDIPAHKIKDIGIAIVPREAGETAENDLELWDVYLINLKKNPIFNVLIAAEGYGVIEEKKVKTAIFRMFFDEIAPEFAVKIEPISAELFSLTNQYWLSFKNEEVMFDRKYVFVNGSINRKYLTNIPLLEKKGVLIM